MVKNSSELSGETDRFQMHINSLKASQCASEESILSSSHRAQAAENQAKVFMIKYD